MLFNYAERGASFHAVHNFRRFTVIIDIYERNDILAFDNTGMVPLRLIMYNA